MSDAPSSPTLREATLQQLVHEIAKRFPRYAVAVREADGSSITCTSHDARGLAHQVREACKGRQ